ASTSKGHAKRSNKNEPWIVTAFKKCWTGRCQRPASWSSSKYFTLQGWGLTLLGRKFFGSDAT
ncbi:MAG: hypothetical protein WA261_14675, partial [Candidatus Sulfotelmatobacter sp.]